MAPAGMFSNAECLGEYPPEILVPFTETYFRMVRFCDVERKRAFIGVSGRKKIVKIPVRALASPTVRYMIPRQSLEKGSQFNR